mmetsp:Transcript_87890/g.121155  ORF Transcript_87890/g.121155 Transcript_87890/m.121155 type:complete len:105 (-) Transcript_87890:377-691(-)
MASSPLSSLLLLLACAATAEALRLAPTTGLARPVPIARAPALIMAEDDSGLSPAVGYAYIGLLTGSVFLAATATSTGSPPNGLLIVMIAFSVGTVLANFLVKSD